MASLVAIKEGMGVFAMKEAACGGGGNVGGDGFSRDKDMFGEWGRATDKVEEYDQMMIKTWIMLLSPFFLYLLSYLCSSSRFSDISDRSPVFSNDSSLPRCFSTSRGSLDSRIFEEEDCAGEGVETEQSSIETIWRWVASNPEADLAEAGETTLKIT
ncbi:hypothetical protein SLEP1_g25211 [Rubroshorea leprosula]|uniref:Uncharacterized protein n=1 Tax=Rubroshorea leprosula TaxID=152421 RepID=A0AAV5JNJ1_9ROSI|nr:hypothetical protein SLEP1_g25211 [Rubroshorea leprosula]